LFSCSFFCFRLGKISPGTLQSSYGLVETTEITMGFLRIIITVKPVLRGHLWDREKVAL